MSDGQTNGKEAPTPAITITFTSDGQMALHAEGVGPPQMWAASRLIELWADSEFAAQQLRQQTGGREIVTPGGVQRIKS